MWLFTKQGFFSAVQHKDEPDMIIVRARLKQDAERLAEFVSVTCSCDQPAVEQTVAADYLFRLTLPWVQWRDVLAELAMQIDYPNFKDAVHALPDDHDRTWAYLMVWQIMHDLQEEEAVDDEPTELARQLLDMLSGQHTPDDLDDALQAAVVPFCNGLFHYVDPEAVLHAARQIIEEGATL